MKNILIIWLLLASYTASAWDGYDYESGSFIEIEKGQLVRTGRDIELFDYGRGEYIDVEVTSIRRTGRNVEIEVIDNETGEERILEMDD